MQKAIDEALTLEAERLASTPVVRALVMLMNEARMRQIGEKDVVAAIKVWLPAENGRK